jgi:hypothetical protein
MKPFFITKIEEVIRISDQRFVAVPAWPKDGLSNRIFVGDQVELRPPNGASLQTKLAGFEHLLGLDRRTSWGLRFPPDIKDSDVPIGTEIWWIAEGPK